MEELRIAFQKIANSTDLKSKFCFFVDGLDEYEGAEEEVTNMLKGLAAFEHIKICASSRPNRHYEQFLKRSDRTFDIADFTQEDMAHHARTILGDCESFQLLAKMEPDCARIVIDISAWAKGVWLWVHPITFEIRKEAIKGENAKTLRKIVNEFPSDFDTLFRCIIKKIHARYREEMAHIFLITIEELQPLPIYAFALLEKERAEPFFEQYAVKAKIQSINEVELSEQFRKLRGKIQNRCGDLLVVDSLPHPVFLSNSVDFLHRTARDFLRDSFRKDLELLVEEGFSPLISLCKICLALLKGADITEFRKAASLKIIIGLTDELLYYARELERRLGGSAVPRLLPILDELDKTNTTFARRNGGNNHWTNARDVPPAQGLDTYAERGTCNFLGLAVQACLTGYVRAKLLANARSLSKDGRPLLDYALRPLRITPIAMPYHSIRDEASVDANMVKLLLEPPLRADPNQQVYMYDKETVWGLFLTSINTTGVEGASSSLKASWFQACKELIRARAQLNYRFVRSDLDVSQILEKMFTPSEVMNLRMELAEAERVRAIEAREAGRSCLVQ